MGEGRWGSFFPTCFCPTLPFTPCLSDSTSHIAPKSQETAWGCTPMRPTRTQVPALLRYARSNPTLRSLRVARWLGAKHFRLGIFLVTFFARKKRYLSLCPL